MILPKIDRGGNDLFQVQMASPLLPLNLPQRCLLHFWTEIHLSLFYVDLVETVNKVLNWGYHEIYAYVLRPAQSTLSWAALAHENRYHIFLGTNNNSRNLCIFSYDSKGVWQKKKQQKWYKNYRNYVYRKWKSQQCTEKLNSKIDCCTMLTNNNSS